MSKEVKEISIAELIPDNKNFNKGTEYGGHLLEKSFEQFGAGRSILLDKNNRIIAGNKATEKYGATGGEKVIVVETDGNTLVAVKRTDVDLDSKKGRELALADNATQKADLDWDDDMLNEVCDEWEIDEKEWGIFDEDEKEENVEEQEVKEDEYTEDVESRCVLGDVWQLGEHRLMCGDSTSEDDFSKLMDGNIAHISFTSPPYNAGCLNIQGNERTKKKYKTYDDNLSEHDYSNFIESNLSLLLQYSEEVLYNIGLVENNKRCIIRLCNTFIDKFKDVIYWEKDNVAPHIIGGVINNKVEFILCFGDGKRKFKNAQFSQGTYYNVIKGANASRNEFSKIHKATFPVYLPENIIKNFCPENGNVIDCFGGTGTTLIACEQLNRHCYMMELDPHYCDVIINRWETLTGRKAERIK